MEFVDALRLAQRTREIIIQNLPRPLVGRYQCLA